MGSTTTRRTSAEARYRRILKESEGGTSLATLARRYGVKQTTITWWRSELRRRDRARAKKGQPKLVPVRLEPSVKKATRTSPAGFEVLLRSGRVVRVPTGFDADELRRLLPVVEQAAC